MPLIFSCLLFARYSRNCVYLALTFFFSLARYNTDVVIYVIRKSPITLVWTLKRGHDELRSDLYTDRNHDCSPARTACLTLRELASISRYLFSRLIAMYVSMDVYNVGLILSKGNSATILVLAIKEI